MPERPNSANDIPWTRIGVEGVVVVLSILLAFAIDAAWDARAERAQERAVLVSLARDLDLNRARVVAGTQAHERSLDAALDLLAVVDGSPVPASVVLDSLLEASLVSGPTVNLSNGSLDALLASGRLDIVRNETLRSNLAAWPSRVEETVEEERWLINEVQMRSIPYLNSLIRTRNLLAQYPAVDDVLVRIPDAGYEALWIDASFENHLSMRVFNEKLILSDLSDLAADLDTLIGLVENELAR